MYFPIDYCVTLLLLIHEQHLTTLDRESTSDHIEDTTKVKLSELEALSMLSECRWGFAY